MANTILLIALDDDAMADVRWGRVGETRCRFAARLDLAEGGSELAAMAQGSRVVVLVPARHVVLRQTTFHGKARQATPLALAYSHEIGLLTDVEQMHWAVLGKVQRDFTIAGVALAQMQGWVDSLNACGIRADALLPDVLALPLPNQCSALRWRGQWLLRTGGMQGMQLPDAWGTASRGRRRIGVCTAAERCRRAGKRRVSMRIRCGDWRKRPGIAHPRCCRGVSNRACVGRAVCPIRPPARCCCSAVRCCWGACITN